MLSENSTVADSNAPQMSKYILFSVIAGLVIGVDQLTKILILNRLQLGQVVPIIPGFFNLTHVHNPGGAFGFLASNGSILRPIVFFGAAILALGLILYFQYKTPESYRYLSSALALVFGGAIGNLIDRFRMGEVVDFLDVYVGSHHWPSFNVADSAITIGVAIFIFHIFTNRLPE